MYNITHPTVEQQSDRGCRAKGDLSTTPQAAIHIGMRVIDGHSVRMMYTYMRHDNKMAVYTTLQTIILSVYQHR